MGKDINENSFADFMGWNDSRPSAGDALSKMATGKTIGQHVTNVRNKVVNKITGNDTVKNGATPSKSSTTKTTNTQSDLEKGPTKFQNFVYNNTGKFGRNLKLDKLKQVRAEQQKSRGERDVAQQAHNTSIKNTNAAGAEYTFAKDANAKSGGQLKGHEVEAKKDLDTAISKQKETGKTLDVTKQKVVNKNNMAHKWRTGSTSFQNSLDKFDNLLIKTCSKLEQLKAQKEKNLKGMKETPLPSQKFARSIIAKNIDKKIKDLGEGIDSLDTTLENINTAVSAFAPYPTTLAGEEHPSKEKKHGKEKKAMLGYTFLKIRKVK